MRVLCGSKRRIGALRAQAFQDPRMPRDRKQLLAAGRMTRYAEYMYSRVSGAVLG